MKSLLELLKWTDKFQNENMKEIIIFLKKYKEKIYFIKSKKEIKEILKRKLFQLPFYSSIKIPSSFNLSSTSLKIFSFSAIIV